MPGTTYHVQIEVIVHRYGDGCHAVIMFVIMTMTVGVVGVIDVVSMSIWHITVTHRVRMVLFVWARVTIAARTLRMAVCLVNVTMSIRRMSRLVVLYVTMATWWPIVQLQHDSPSSACPAQQTRLKGEKIAQQMNDKLPLTLGIVLFSCSLIPSWNDEEE